MRAESDDVLHRKLNVSAVWSADLSPIRSHASHQTAQRRAGFPGVRNSPFSHIANDHFNGVDEGCPPQPQRSKTALPSGSLFPHLVRSRSPPGHLPTSPSASASTDANSRGDAEATVLLQEQRACRSARVNDTFADVLARDWPFESLPRDTLDFTEAVRFGQDSALMHYANSGFQDVSSRLAREAGAVAMEADRYRAAAQHSSMQCHGAVLAYTHAQEELTAAEQQLQSLLNAEEQKQKAVDEVQKQKEALQSPTAASDPSIVALTLQLDQELATMRTRKHRYELLCTQKAHLEAKVEDWTAKERRLEAKLEREQVRRGRELEDALRRVHAKPSFPEEQLLTDQASRSKARLHDFDVCITERLELLRHLQDGSATRLEQLTTLLTRTRERSGNDVCNEQSTRKEVNQQMLATYSTAEGKSAGERQQNRSHVGNADGETSRGGATMKLLEYLSTMHKTVLLGEEAALKEMEHVRVLLHRLQRQESSQSAMEKTTSIHS